MFFKIFVQVIGFVGIGLNLIALQFNKHWQIVLLRTLGSAAFVVQYILLGAITGAAMDGIGLVRNLLFILLVKKKQPTYSYIAIFCLLTIMIGVETWEGWISLLAIIAKLTSTIAYGIKSAHVIRMMNLPSNGCWIAYNALHFSLAGVVDAVLAIASVIIAEIRFRKKPTKADESASPKNA